MNIPDTNTFTASLCHHCSYNYIWDLDFPPSDDTRGVALEVRCIVYSLIVRKTRHERYPLEPRGVLQRHGTPPNPSLTPPQHNRLKTTIKRSTQYCPNSSFPGTAHVAFSASWAVSEERTAETGFQCHLYIISLLYGRYKHWMYSKWRILRNPIFRGVVFYHLASFCISLCLTLSLILSLPTSLFLFVSFFLSFSP